MILQVRLSMTYWSFFKLRFYERIKTKQLNTLILMDVSPPTKEKRGQR